MLKGEESFVKLLNPLNIISGSALFVYQNVFSKQISSGCLYTPGCSDFSKGAIREYGIFKGVMLSVDRLHRCNGLSAIDLKNHLKDTQTHRYPDPVSGYKTVKIRNGE